MDDCHKCLKLFHRIELLTIVKSEEKYIFNISQEIYKQDVAYDPEGLLGTLNSCFLCFLGLQVFMCLFNLMSVFNVNFSYLSAGDL